MKAFKFSVSGKSFFLVESEIVLGEDKGLQRELFVLKGEDEEKIIVPEIETSKIPAGILEAAQRYAVPDENYRRGIICLDSNFVWPGIGKRGHVECRAIVQTRSTVCKPDDWITTDHSASLG